MNNKQIPNETDQSNLSVLMSEKRKFRELSSDAVRRMVARGDTDATDLRSKRRMLEKHILKSVSRKRTLTSRLKLAAAIAMMVAALGTGNLLWSKDAEAAVDPANYSFASHQRPAYYTSEPLPDFLVEEIKAFNSPGFAFKAPESYSISDNKRPEGVTTSLLFVDPGVDNYESLIKNLRPGTEVFVLNSGRDGIEQIAAILDDYVNLKSIEILSHGAPGQIKLADSVLSEKNLNNYKDSLEAWGDALKVSADILVYGCNVAEGEEGRRFIEALSFMTGADVAASDDITGATALEGDWDLEARTGKIKTSSALNGIAIAGYEGQLAIAAGTESFDFAAWSPASASGATPMSLTQTENNIKFVGHASSWSFVTMHILSAEQGLGPDAQLWLQPGSDHDNGYVKISAADASDFGVTGFQGAFVKGTSEYNVVVQGYNNTVEVGKKTIVVASGSGSQVNSVDLISGLDSGSFATIDEMKISGHKMFIDDIVFTSGVSSDSDGTLTASAGVTEPVAIATTTDTIGEAVNVFDFTIGDGGTSDASTLDVSQSVLNTSGTGDFSKLTWRLNGPDASNVTGTYSGGANTITFSGLSISVADGGTETYTVNAYYNDNTGHTEGQTFILSVDGDTDLTVGGSGTQMGTTSAVNNSTGSTVDVTATALSYTTQPSGSTSGSTLVTQPVVKAVDVGGNVDTDFSETITLTEASIGTLTGNAKAAVSGAATFTALTYTATADQQSFTLTANDQDGVGSDLSTVDAGSSITCDVVATKLLFTTEPAPTTVPSGQPTAFTTVPVVAAVDANDVTDTGYSSGIALAEANGAGSATMTGTGDTDGNGATVTLTPSSGVSTFTALNITYTASGGSDETFNLQATSGGLTSANSATLTGSVNAAPTATNRTQTVNFTEDTTADIADIVITDPDADTFMVTILMASNNNSLGSLTASSGNGEDFNPGTGIWSISSGTLADVNSALAAMQFVPPANGSTNTTASVSISDGVAAALTGTITFSGTAVGDTPSVTGASTNEDTQSSSGLVITKSGNDGIEVTHYKITSLTGGTLYKNDGSTAIANNSFITVAEGSAGLKFTPSTNSVSSGSFYVQAGTGDSGGGLSVSSAMATITVTPVNDTPTLTNLNGDGVNYSIGGSGVVLDASSDATLADVDSTDFDGGNVTVSITANGQNGEDVLQVGTVGNITTSGLDVNHNDGVTIATMTGGTGGASLVITLNGNANIARVRDLISALQYMNTDGATINTLDRTVRIIVDDGDGGSSTSVNQDVTVSLLRAPIIDLDGDDSSGAGSGGYNGSFTEGGGAVVTADSDSSISDDGTFKTLTVTLTNRPDGTSESLSSTYGTGPQTVNSEAVTIAAYDSGTGGLTITINDASTTDVTMELLMESILYNNTSGVPDTTNRSISYVAVDNADNAGAVSTAVISLTTVNDQPTFTGLDGTPAYTEGGASVTLDSNVVIADLELDDTNNYNGATLTLSRNGGVSANDQFFATGTLSTLTQGIAFSLGAGNIGTVTTNSAGTLVLTFNASATSANVDTVLQSINYSNSSSSPLASVQVDWVFSDGNSGAQGTGGAKAATGSTTVNITAVNSAPAFIGTPAIGGIAVVGNELSLTDTGTSDADGDLVSLSYQWKADAANISGATSNKYTLTADEMNKTITCLIIADDGQGKANSTDSVTTGGVSVLADADLDGVADGSDAFSLDPAASVDTDGDGHPDSWNTGKTETDSTTGLTLDAFPSDPDGWNDSDSDGLPDEWETANLGDLSETASMDSDADGLTNLEEYRISTDPQTDNATFADADSDSLPDSWETANFGDLTTSDSTGDSDSDGISDIREYYLATDPRVDNSDTEFVADSDFDGIPDMVELANGTNPNVVDATSDPDGDGLSNLEEYYLASGANEDNSLMTDTDSDGIPDLVEIAAGLVPGFDDSASYIDYMNGMLGMVLTDDEGDGLPDLWEKANGLDPALNNGTSDTDGDGLSDITEYTLGYDPTDGSDNAPPAPVTVTTADGTEAAMTGAVTISFNASVDPEGEPISYYASLYQGLTATGAPLETDILVYPGTGYLFTLSDEGVYTVVIRASDDNSSSPVTVRRIAYTDGTIDGDINFDGVVDGYDLILLSVVFGKSDSDPVINPFADINNDAIVDGSDLADLANNFGLYRP